MADWAAARIACVSGHAVPRTSVDSLRCTRCHADDIKGVQEYGGIKIRHSDPLAAGMLCTDCHPGAGHTQADVLKVANTQTAKSSQSIMNRCVVCHDGRTAPSGCDVCHTHSPNDDPGAAGGVQATINAQTTCVGCHTPKVAASCVDCHGLELPHPMPKFLGQHARMSNSEPSLCQKCHETARYDPPCGCHNGSEDSNNPHGTYSEWFPKHGPAAATSWPGACRCHDDNFCLVCHTSLPAVKGGER
jgi:hypothetical protein